MLFFGVFSLFLVGITAFVIPTPFAQKSGSVFRGTEAQIENRPFSAAIVYDSRTDYNLLFCGASILSPKYLLSAALYLDTIPYDYTLFARVGSSDRTFGGVLIEVIDVVIHNTLGPAVLTLSREIKFGPTVRPVVLQTSPDPQENEIVTVSGWGTITDQSSRPSKILHQVDLPVANEKCRQIGEGFICFGGTQEGTDNCIGNLGSPVTYNDAQIAIVMQTANCGVPNVSENYIRILPYLDWIKEKAKLLN